MKNNRTFSAKITVEQAHKRAEIEARDNLIDKARAYAHLFITAEHVANKSGQYAATNLDEECQKLDALIYATQYYDELVTR